MKSYIETFGFDSTLDADCRISIAYRKYVIYVDIVSKYVLTTQQIFYRLSES